MEDVLPWCLVLVSEHLPCEHVARMSCSSKHLLELVQEAQVWRVIFYRDFGALQTVLAEMNNPSPTADSPSWWRNRYRHEWQRPRMPLLDAIYMLADVPLRTLWDPGMVRALLSSTDGTLLHSLAETFPSLYRRAMRTRYRQLTRAMAVFEGRRATITALWAGLYITVGRFLGAVPHSPDKPWIWRMSCFSGSRMILEAGKGGMWHNAVAAVKDHWKMLMASAMLTVYSSRTEPHESAEHQKLINTEARLWAVGSFISR